MVRGLVSDHLAALTFRDDRSCYYPRLAIAAGLALHLAGLAAFWRYYHQSIWLAIPTLLIFLVLPVWRARGSLDTASLAPLFFLYAILLSRVVAVRVLLANEPYADEASFADPRFIFFQIEAATAAVIAYTVLVQTVRLFRGQARTRLLAGSALLFAIAALVWFAAETIRHRTRGVTATDPYAYAQMAVDLASRSTPLHAFPLFPYVVNLEVSWYPIEHIGYRLFDNLTGLVPSVWPIGGSFWMAALYRLIGEEGLYVATPLAALLALIAFALLAMEYLMPRDSESGMPLLQRLAVMASSVALLATSWEQVDRSIVPLVDVQAQLFSVLAVLFTLTGARSLEGRRRETPRAKQPAQSSKQKADISLPSAMFPVPAALRPALYAVLAGLSLGAAYFVRHTQLLMVVPMIVAVLVLARQDRLRFLVVMAVSALIVALPDLWYHHQYIGGWLTPESHELALFSVASVLPGIKALGERFLAGNEFGYLVPFLLYGAYRAARTDRRRFAVLAAWTLALVGFHLLYAAVKLRDLLPEYPAVILLTGYGIVALVSDVRQWATRERVTRLVRGAEESTAAHMLKQGVVALVIFFALLLPAMRVRMTILRPFQPPKVTFGYLTANQRAAFDQIAKLTGDDAVIGSTMNDGPIDLYAQRATFRPGEWDSEERIRFVDTMLNAKRAVYLLEDGAETSAARRDLAKRYDLQQITVLDVPLFGAVEGTPGALWEIRRLVP